VPYHSGQRDRRIAELKAELAEERDLTYRLAEQVRDSNDTLDNWIQAFDMVQDEDGVWIWSGAFVEGIEWLHKYRALVTKWNKFVGKYNARIGYGRNRGRPLEASETQAAEVRKRHKAGESLRSIAETMSLGVRTVRTIVAKQAGVDRTTLKHLERIDPERAQQRMWEAKARSRKRLPKTIYEVRKVGDGLLKEAKGLK
jgi:hypothetical protein